jgi:hypothetical protein
MGGPGWNPLAPRDSVAAFQMARDLVRGGRFDHYVAVAPEGHVYGYFFERLGLPIRSVYVDYPPRRADAGPELAEVRGGRVLLLEDDIISGESLRLVVAALAPYGPRSLALYLGRDKEDQQLHNVPAPIEAVYLAEDHFDSADRTRHEAEFAAFFAGLPDQEGLDAG